MLTMTKESIIKNYFAGLTVKEIIDKLFKQEKESGIRKYEVQEFVESTIANIKFD